MTREFITALQFLTRIRLFRDPDYDDGLFGRSVKFFPLIGLLAGSIYPARRLRAMPCARPWRDWSCRPGNSNIGKAISGSR